MIYLASCAGSAEACIDLTKWVHRPLRVRQMLRGYYQLFVELDLNWLKKKEKNKPILLLIVIPVQNGVHLEQKVFCMSLQIKT